MTTVTVGNEFKEDGSLATGDPVTGVLYGLLHGDDIHSVRLDTGDLVATSEVLGIGGASRSGGTHTILVVLANEDSREVPQLSLLDTKPNLGTHTLKRNQRKYYEPC